jgi:hypothetical protein
VSQVWKSQSDGERDDVTLYFPREADGGPRELIASTTQPVLVARRGLGLASEGAVEASSE